jgi:hypothetical protein
MGDGWPRPNELSVDPASHRAEARLAAFFDRLDRLPTDRLDMLAVRPLDPARHQAAAELATLAVRRFGRRELLERGTQAVEEAVRVRVAAGFPIYGDGVIAGALHLRAEDAGRLAATLRDAALAVVSADALDEATFAELVGPCRALVGERGP